MTIKDVHDWIGFVTRKHQSGYHSHEQIDQALDRAQLDVFIDLYGNDKQYQPGRPVPPTVYGETIFIHHALEPFKDKYTFTTVATPGGVVTMPAPCQIVLSLSTKAYSTKLGRDVVRRVELVNEEELIDRLESQVAPVSLYAPIALINKENKIQLYPEQPQQGTIWYLRRPAAPVYSYSISGRTETFNPGTSVDLEWKDTYLNRVIFKALPYLGVNLSDQEVTQFGDYKDKQGS
jgi:hypothetical protein